MLCKWIVNNKKCMSFLRKQESSILNKLIIVEINKIVDLTKYIINTKIE